MPHSPPKAPGGRLALASWSLFAPPGELPATLVNRLALARTMLRVRRARTRFFAAETLGEPGWDLLLILYVAHCEARAMTVGATARALTLPIATTLRWIATLEEAGSLCHQSAAGNGGLGLVSLSESAREALEAYLDSLGLEVGEDDGG